MHACFIFKNKLKITLKIITMFGWVTSISRQHHGLVTLNSTKLIRSDEGLVLLKTSAIYRLTPESAKHQNSRKSQISFF